MKEAIQRIFVKGQETSSGVFMPVPASVVKSITIEELMYAMKVAQDPDTDEQTRKQILNTSIQITVPKP